MKRRSSQLRSAASALVRPSGLPANYRALLDDLKARIRAAQVRAGLAVNRELIQLYWDIGRAIAAKQEVEGWGAKVIDRLAADLQREFPGIAGFSRANVYRMRAFYLAYAASLPNVAQPVRQMETMTTSLDLPVVDLPWGHNVVLLQQLSIPAVRLWYAQQAIANGWSRNMLVHWIESDLYGRQGRAVTNFRQTLPSPQSDLAQQIVKDPYNFDFLTLHAEAAEPGRQTPQRAPDRGRDGQGLAAPRQEKASSPRKGRDTETLRPRRRRVQPSESFSLLAAGRLLLCPFTPLARRQPAGVGQIARRPRRCRPGRTGGPASGRWPGLRG